MPSTTAHSSHPAQWNAGGWFGSQIGCSCWILVAGVLSYSHNPTVAMLVITLFASFNLAGYVLWSSRNRLSVHAGFQWLLLLAGLTSLLAVYVLDSNGLYLRIQSGGSISARRSYFLIAALILALMTLFYFRFGRRQA